MKTPFTPVRWAIEVTNVLNMVLGPDHFPINVVDVAKEYSSQRFSSDPITLIQGDNLPGFDGALFPAPTQQKGWGIIYNKGIASEGRINFTLAHEFGHYLLHRLSNPDGIRCSEDDLTRWDSAYGQMESQANEFAANLLMPYDDYRRQVFSDAKVDLDLISFCADRYKVSLIAALLRWLSFTTCRAVVVVSRDGYIKWARSSDAALKTGAFFRTSGPPIEVPASSLAANRIDSHHARAGIKHGPNVWLGEEAVEMAIYSDQYDFTISLLHLQSSGSYFQLNADEETDVFERISRGR